MNRIIYWLLSCLMLLGGRRLLFWLIGPVGSEQAAGHAGKRHLMADLVNRLNETLGVEKIDGVASSFVIVAATIGAALFGWMCDAALGERAFGPRRNGLIAFAAGAFSAIVWVQLVPHPPAQQGADLLVIGALGSSLTLCALSIVKQAVKDRFDDFGRGACSALARNDRARSRIEAVSRRRP
jgi:hypothetical protein